jgi:nitrate/nitrite transport system substrate-binding protein
MSTGVFSENHILTRQTRKKGFVNTLQEMITPAAFAVVLSVSCAFTAFVQIVELGYPEKEAPTFDFIKLADMAPIAIAYENGYFEDEGLYVTIEAQAN